MRKKKNWESVVDYDFSSLYSMMMSDRTFETNAERLRKERKEKIENLIIIDNEDNRST